MQKKIRQNYLTKDNGCSIIEVSSEQRDDKRLATNILDEDRGLWVTEGKPPQYCVINTSKMKKYPKVFNMIGFYCWHEYDSNPALIQISYSDSAQHEWIKVGKLKLQYISQKQYYKIKDIPSTQMKLLKINILQNFGDTKTYLNQIELGYVKQSAANDQNRQKTFSQYVKLTSTQKQLKKAQQKLKKISQQNEQIKVTVMKQGAIIIEMQQSFKLLTKELEKVHKLQLLQQEKIQQLQKREVPKKKKQTNSLQNYYQNQNDGQKKYIEDTLISKKTKEFLNSYSYAKSHKNSIKKSKQSQGISSNKYKKNNASKNERYLIDNGTSSDISEYDASQHQKSKYTQKCSDMIERLQKLIAQKQRRQKQLKKKKEISVKQ